MHIGTNSKKLDISSEKQTRALAKRLSNFFKKGDLVFLFGEIGTGKTTFVKNFINNLQKKKPRKYYGRSKSNIQYIKRI